MAVGFIRYNKWLLKGWFVSVLVVVATTAGCGDQSKNGWLKPPTSVTATPSHRSILLDWALMPEAKVYNVYWSEATGVSPTNGEGQRNVQPPFLLTGLTNGTPYYTIVTSVNASGESPASNEVAATPATGPPLENPMGVFTGEEVFSGQEFGWSVGIDRNLAVIGAPSYTNNNLLNAGAIYLFRRSTVTGLWQQISLITPTDPVAGARFGAAVAIFRGVILVGSPGATADTATNAGAVYTYYEDPTTLKWGENGKTTAVAPVAGEGFGSTVALTSSLVAIGTPYRTAGGQAEAGGINTYSLSAGVLTPLATLAPPTPELGGHFGIALDLDGYTLIAGAPAIDTVAGGVTYIDAGAAYAYVLDPSSLVWSAPTVLTSGTPQNNGYFSSSVSVSSNRAAFGQPKASVAFGGADVLEAGRVEVFDRDTATGNWVASGDLVAPDPTANSHFGSATGVIGDVVVAGAPFGSDETGVSQGAAYIFKYDATTSTWTAGKKLPNIAPKAEEKTAHAIAIDAGGVLLGAPGRPVLGELLTGGFFAFE